MTQYSTGGDSIIELLLGSIVLIVYGYLIFIRKKTFLHPLEKGAIVILRKFYGDDRANAREAELISPKRLKRNGLIALILGTINLILVIILVILLNLLE